MSKSDVVFKITVNDQCPCYEVGDTFRLSGNAILLDLQDDTTFIATAVIRPPANKKACRTLLGDLTRALAEHENIDRIPQQTFRCSGCTGMITIEPSRRPTAGAAADKENNPKNIDIIAEVLGKLSIFQSLDRHHLRDMVSLLKLKKYPRNAVILKKGAPAQNLYIILSGSVDVLNEDGIRLSTLQKGDVFGEMSLISDQPVGATVKVTQAATIIFIRGQDFKRVLNRFPSIQMYLARLLAQRLSRSNLVVAEEIASGMIGRLSEMPPSELFQTLNLNQKTGLLSLTLPGGEAELCFRNGELVGARFNDRVGEEAFYQLLKENDGRFKFFPKLSDAQMQAPVIGPFMEMLLEGLRRMDEDRVENEEPGQALM
jgi:CRP/FNR family cyclic AMP-dependent transcriptional regulator